MIFILKTLRAAIVVAAYGAIGYVVWKKLQPAEAVPASPYPSAGARPSPMPRNPVGPVEPALIRNGPDAQTNHATADLKPADTEVDRAETDRTTDEVEPESKIDLSVPLVTGDVDQAD